MKAPEDCTSIEEVRHSIDTLDRQIVRLIGSRSRYVKAAASFKTSDASVRAPERQKAMLEERRRWAQEEGLNPDAIEKMYRDLVSYFIGRELDDWKSTDYACNPLLLRNILNKVYSPGCLGVTSRRYWELLENGLQVNISKVCVSRKSRN